MMKLVSKELGLKFMSYEYEGVLPNQVAQLQEHFSQLNECEEKREDQDFIFYIQGIPSILKGSYLQTTTQRREFQLFFRSFLLKKVGRVKQIVVALQLGKQKSPPFLAKILGSNFLSNYDRVKLVKLPQVTESKIEQCLKRIKSAQGILGADEAYIAMTYAPDLRKAINQLELYQSKPIIRVESSTLQKRIKRSASQLHRFQHTDNISNDFHALSKFLYNKRVNPASHSPRVPQKMSPALLKSQPDIYFNPFTVMESSNIGATLFSEYLYENMLSFFNDVSDLSQIQSRYSRTQALEEEMPYSFYNAPQIEQIKTVLGISRSIGVMHDNIHSYPEETREEETSQGRKRGYFQLTKPKFTAMRQERKTNELSLLELQKELASVYGIHHPLAFLATDLLPFTPIGSQEFRKLSEFQQQEENGFRNEYVGNAVEDLGIHSEDEAIKGGAIIRRRKLSEIKEESISEIFEEISDSETESEEEPILTLDDLKLIESED